MRKSVIALFCCLMVSACTSREIPECPYTGKPDFAPSAGCLALIHGKVLVVESRLGGLTPPGGKSRTGEPAQCTAHRETFEETGLDLIPRQRLHVFDTGFHLYLCEIHAGSGLFDLDVLEVKRGLWLSIEDFDEVTWLYEGQGEALRKLLQPGEG